MKQKMIIGRLESITLPEFKIHDMSIKTDTGAKTSSLHVDNIVVLSVEGKQIVQFDIHPDIHNVDKITHCETSVFDIREIKSSNGSIERRYVIKTPMILGTETWEIEITLSDRSSMNYLMLLGCQAMNGKVLVDPSAVFLQSTDSTA